MIPGDFHVRPTGCEPAAIKAELFLEDKRSCSEYSPNIFFLKAEIVLSSIFKVA